MANHEWEDKADRWVDERLAGLAPDGEWTPNAGSALVRLREKNRERAMAAQRWIWTTLVAACAGAALLLLPASRACAEQPDRCVQRVLGVVTPANHQPANQQLVAPAISPPAQAPVVSVPVGKVPVSAVLPGRNFKEIGNASAPVSVEIYLDYECAYCETFVRDVAPLLAEQYINTGKAKLLYRDYPLPTHRYAKLAARYADAAGELGYYGAAMRQLFATRGTWSASGDIDSQLAEVFPAGVMEKLRQRMTNDPDPDACLAADLAAGQADHLDRTPFVVIVSGRRREAITDSTFTFDVMKRNLDHLVRN